MQPFVISILLFLLLFQSSPDPEAGCNPADDAIKTFVSGFNPHPTRRPGATRVDIKGYGSF